MMASHPGSEAAKQAQILILPLCFMDGVGFLCWNVVSGSFLDVTLGFSVSPWTITHFALGGIYFRSPGFLSRNCSKCLVTLSTLVSIKNSSSKVRQWLLHLSVLSRSDFTSSLSSLNKAGHPNPLPSMPHLFNWVPLI